MTYTFDSEMLRDLISTGRKALAGDSNDAEHDALYEIVEALEALTVMPQASSISSTQ